VQTTPRGILHLRPCPIPHMTNPGLEGVGDREQAACIEHQLYALMISSDPNNCL
jgi:hypothetical protein